MLTGYPGRLLVGDISLYYDSVQRSIRFLHFLKSRESESLGKELELRHPVQLICWIYFPRLRPMRRVPG